MPECVILVSSCDKYSACWAPFLHGLEKYWPQHPPVTFITNQLDAPAGISIKTGQDLGWSANLQLALSRIEANFILYSQEDYWIKAPVNHFQILEYCELMETGAADYIRLYPAPPPDQPFHRDSRLGTILPGSRYRTSLQMALWRKETLLSLLVPKETPWKFEVNGSKRSARYADRFLCVQKRRHGIDYVFTAIVNGYWSEKAYEYARLEGIAIEYESLPTKSAARRIKDQIRSKAYQVRKKILGD